MQFHRSIHPESAPLGKVLNAAPVRQEHALLELDRRLTAGLDAAGVKNSGLDSVKAAQLTLESVDLRNLSPMLHRRESESAYLSWSDLLSGSGHTLHIIGDASVLISRGAHSNLRVDEIEQRGAASSIRSTREGLEFRSLGEREATATHRFAVDYRSMNASLTMECDPHIDQNASPSGVWSRASGHPALGRVLDSPEDFRVMTVGTSNENVPGTIVVVPKSSAFFHAYEGHTALPEIRNLELFGFRTIPQVPFSSRDFNEFEKAKNLPGDFAPNMAAWQDRDRDLYGRNIAMLRTASGFAVVISESKESEDRISALIPPVPHESVTSHETKNFRFVAMEGKTGRDLARILSTLAGLPDLIQARKVDLTGATM